MADRLGGLLGLARRAGKVTCGADAIVRDVLHGRAKVVLFASDAAERTVKNIAAACRESGVESYTVPYDKALLGLKVGRDATAAAAVCDGAFAAGISDICREITGGIC